MAQAEPVHVLRGHFGEVQSVSFLSEEALVSGDSHGDVRLWDVESCRPVQKCRLHDANAGVLLLRCLPQHGAVLSQGRDGCVRLWAVSDTGTLDSRQPLHEFRTESFNFCRCAVWSDPGPSPAHAPPAGPLLVACAGHDPADVVLWRPSEGPAPSLVLRQTALDPKHGMCMSVAFLPPPGPAPAQRGATSIPTARTIARGSGPGAGCEGEREPGTRGRDEAGNGPAEAVQGRGQGAGEAAGEAAREAAGAVAESGCGPVHVVTGYEDGVVALWDVRAPGRPLGELRQHQEPVLCVAAWRAPERGGAAGAGAEAAAVEAEAAQGSGQAADGSKDAGAGACYIVSGSAGSTVGCCTAHLATARPLRPSKHPPPPLRQAGTNDVAVRPDGRLFACAGWDGRARLYTLRKRQEPLAVLKYHSDQVTALAFNPGRQLLATASRDTTIALWDVYSSNGTDGGGGGGDGTRD